MFNALENSDLEFLPELQQTLAVSVLYRHLEVSQLPPLLWAVKLSDISERNKISLKQTILPAYNTSLRTLPNIQSYKQPSWASQRNSGSSEFTTFSLKTNNDQDEPLSLMGKHC